MKWAGPVAAPKPPYLPSPDAVTTAELLAAGYRIAFTSHSYEVWYRHGFIHSSGHALSHPGVPWAYFNRAVEFCYEHMRGQR